MTTKEFESTIENFLHTLDKFGITSSDYGHPLYVETEWLEMYWLKQGIELSE